ncbi:hypothetical protein LTR28_003924 [Elasticomyces elasticus]|nr:hypothetical protein LTR28_003924 [Elasticomyces elasticus]
MTHTTQQQRPRTSSAANAHGNKRVKMAGPLIGTHSGHFHADEALAVYMLRLLPTYTSSPLVRTRDSEQLKTCHTVVDVGGVYDSSPEVNRYDHHQREFTTVFPGHATKLSSAGLVYMHFGRAVLAQVTGLPESSDDVDLLYQKIYDDFIEAFDANDNGIAAYDPGALRKAGIERKFSDKGFSMASVVNRFNYGRSKDEVKNEQMSKDEQQAAEDARFAQASEFVGGQFVAEVTDKASAWLPARTVVKQAFEDRYQYDKHGRIMVLKQEGVPFTDHLYGFEAAASSAIGSHTPNLANGAVGALIANEAAQSNTQASSDGKVLYVLFPESTQPDSKWRIRAVSIDAGSFENRKALPDAWKGLRDTELDRVSGVDGCVFVHASGFIGGNKTFEGALRMAQLAVDM